MALCIFARMSYALRLINKMVSNKCNQELASFNNSVATTSTGANEIPGGFGFEFLIS